MGWGVTGERVGDHDGGNSSNAVDDQVACKHLEAILGTKEHKWVLIKHCACCFLRTLWSWSVGTGGYTDSRYWCGVSTCY